VIAIAREITPRSASTSAVIAETKNDARTRPKVARQIEAGLSRALGPRPREVMVQSGEAGMA